MSVRRRLTVAALVLPVVAVIVGIAWAFPTDSPDLEFDLRVYLGAVKAMLSGSPGGLYGFALADVAGPAAFLYPPFAAFLMIPAAQVSFGSMATAWFLVQIGLCLLMVRLVLRCSWEARGESGRLLTEAAALLLVSTSAPVVLGMALGQVSLAITAMIVFDVLLLPPRWRGCLIGLAAAIKLTPLIFVVFFLVSGQRRAAVNATAAFGLATAIGFLVLPTESLQYWTSVVFDGTRVPGIGSNRNLSLLGALQAANVPESWQLPAWLLAGSLLGVAALARGRRHHARGETVASFLVIGVASAVLSPVSWVHFLVWLPLAALYLAVGPFPKAIRGAGWAGLALLNTLSPVWLAEAGLIAHSVALGLVVLLAVICVTGLPRARTTASARPKTPSLIPAAARE